MLISFLQPGICRGDSLPPGINDTVSYPGGETALQGFLFSHNIFNSSQAEYSIEGIVVLRLSIDPSGNVHAKDILRGIGGEIDEEALRLAGLLRFNPATNSLGQGISSEYILRVNFYPPKRRYMTSDVAISVEIDEFEALYFKNGPAGFPGGSKKLKQYFKENMVHPTADGELNSTGKVKLMLSINAHGYISFLHVINSSDPRLNEEAIRLVKSVKRWKPEIRENKPVDYGYLMVEVKF